MNLIYKEKGVRAGIKSYISITMPSVPYRLAMQADKLKLPAWVEGNKILGELQNGFTSGRRLDGSLLVLTQCVEIAREENRPLYLDLLDIRAAYDNLNRELLWRILEDRGIGEEMRIAE